MNLALNERAVQLTDQICQTADELRIGVTQLESGGRVFDFGVECRGSLEAGRMLARVCLSGLGEVSIHPGELNGIAWPQVFVTTDHPTAACLLSQYAGWQINVDGFFAMGSGPMRAAAAVEELFSQLDYRESPRRCVGVLESSKLPTEKVFEFIAEKTGIAADNIDLLVAPTSSSAGNLQVVARSVETSLHKLFELGFDVSRIQSACGTAPLAAVAADDLTGIGRTNDAILYGGRVVLWVTGDDESLREIGPQVPSCASPSFGKPFLEVFEEAGRDFYQIDPHLFSPAEIVFQNVSTGRVHRFGKPSPEVLRESFGVL